MTPAEVAAALAQICGPYARAYVRAGDDFKVFVQKEPTK